MSKYVLIASAIINLILVICVLVVLCRHHKFVKHQSESKENLVTEVRGIGFYVRIIAYIAIFFCLCVAIHYLAFMLPRLLDTESQNTHIQYLGVDYLGLIVAIFAIMVTLLVGWQIYSSIKVKDELKSFEEARADFHNELEQHTKETADKLSELRLLIGTTQMKTYSELLMVTPLYLSAHKENIQRLAEYLDVFKTCSKDSLIAQMLSREFSLGCLMAYNDIEDNEIRQSAITQIKEKCDKEAIAKLYAEFLTYSEEEKESKFKGLNNLFLELLKD